MGKKTTIYDLAKALNVSPATVSRSLNNHSSISNKTRDLVISKAKELGYKVNKFAVNLSTQKSNTVGVIVPKLNSYFMSSILAGIEKVANSAGYNLIISQSLESMEKEKLNAKTLFNSGVDALLVSLASDTVNYDHFNDFIEHKIPVLFFDRIHELPNCPTILIDNQLAGFEATEHLISQGCKKIVYIGGNLKRNVYSERFLGYKKALSNNGLHFKKEYLIETVLDPKKVKEVIAYIKNLDEKIDGIFVANDSFAAHCIKELKLEHYKIPEDIKIIGFNNDPIAKVVSPTLCTVEYPGREMGILAGQSIISYLTGAIDLQPASSIVLRHRLVLRESSLKNK